MSRLTLFDFSAADSWACWEVENDVVMGGKSTSELARSVKGNAVFKGSVSLENNGGFASIQCHFEPKNIDDCEKALILLKGDGKTYQFRIKADLDDKAAYVYEFETTGDWQTVEIPLNEMQPRYRGEKLDKPNFNANQIQEIRFFIGNKKAEEFRLEIDQVELR